MSLCLGTRSFRYKVDETLKSPGFYNRKTNEISVKKYKRNVRRLLSTLAHEIAHPIIDQVYGLEFIREEPVQAEYLVEAVGLEALNHFLGVDISPSKTFLPANEYRVTAKELVSEYQDVTKRELKNGLNVLLHVYKDNPMVAKQLEFYYNKL